MISSSTLESLENDVPLLFDGEGKGGASPRICPSEGRGNSELKSLIVLGCYAMRWAPCAMRFSKQRIGKMMGIYD